MLFKTPWCHRFEAVVNSCVTPVVAPGGSKMSDELHLTMVYRLAVRHSAGPK